MNKEEFSNQFDIHFNNITSNQAPGLNEHEKSVYLTKAQDEIVKNYFTANSKGNNIGQGFDDSAKRQADFSCLMKVGACNKLSSSTAQIDSRSVMYTFPNDVFISINEVAQTSTGGILQVVPLRYDEYLRLMSKPYKRPVKNQAWRLINTGTGSTTKTVEIIAGPGAELSSYSIRYIRRPKPIIVGDLDGLTINGCYLTGTAGPTGATAIDGECELDEILHEDILQRAVELAKISWTATGQDNAQTVLQVGQRSE